MYTITDCFIQQENTLHCLYNAYLQNILHTTILNDMLKKKKHPHLKCKHDNNIHTTHV